MKKIFDDKIFQSSNTAIKDDLGHSITYSELYEEANTLKNIFQKRNIICVFCDKSFETFKFVLEMLIINQPLLMLPEEINPEAVSKITEEYKPFYIWKNKSSEEKNIVMYKNTHCLIKTGHSSYDIHEDLAMLVTTSGSTGNNKIVRLSYNNLHTTIISTETFGFDHNTKSIAILPISYIYGFSFCLWTWHANATLYITKSNAASKEFFEFFENEKINSMAIIPFIMQMLDKFNFWTNTILQQIRFVLLGGAKLDAQSQIKYTELLQRNLWFGYGQTECTPAIISTNSLDAVSKYGTIGKVMKGVTAEIAEDGEMIIKSDAVCMGYAYSYTDLNKGDENSGVMDTGDIVDIDEEGFIYIRGRKKRFVKITGKRISLDDIESILQNSSEYHLACTGDTDMISVYFEGKRDEDAEKYCEEKLHSQLYISKKMLKFIWLDKLPRNESGKILYSKLK